jgi:hypothetical protein
MYIGWAMTLMPPSGSRWTDAGLFFGAFALAILAFLFIRLLNVRVRHALGAPKPAAFLWTDIILALQGAISGLYLLWGFISIMNK